MHKDKLNKFLEGELTHEQIQDELEENSIEKDFIKTYQQIIKGNKTNIPEFDPFEKIESPKSKHVSIIKRFLPYAAIFILVISSMFIYQNYNSNKTELALSEQELNAVQKNTTTALLHFSRELNGCLTKFEEAKKMREPIDEVESLKHIKINRNNPFTKLNFNEL